MRIQQLIDDLTALVERMPPAGDCEVVCMYGGVVEDVVYHLNGGPVELKTRSNVVRIGGEEASKARHPSGQRAPWWAGGTPSIR